jgi:hypothetical protein
MDDDGFACPPFKSEVPPEVKEKVQQLLSAEHIPYMTMKKQKKSKKFSCFFCKLDEKRDSR